MGRENFKDVAIEDYLAIERELQRVRVQQENVKLSIQK